uniref:Uncharacterized protein n=1 Tax=Steinernema glaseri TaxID=37863 RepID=A0A1I7ZFG7_9BILA
MKTNCVRRADPPAPQVASSHSVVTLTAESKSSWLNLECFQVRPLLRRKCGRTREKRLFSRLLVSQRLFREASRYTLLAALPRRRRHSSSAWRRLSAADQTSCTREGEGYKVVGGLDFDSALNTSAERSSAAVNCPEPSRGRKDIAGQRTAMS